MSSKLQKRGFDEEAEGFVIVSQFVGCTSSNMFWVRNTSFSARLFGSEGCSGSLGDKRG